jgi:hypothetical protein
MHSWDFDNGFICRIEDGEDDFEDDVVVVAVDAAEGRSSFYSTEWSILIG